MRQGIGEDAQERFLFLLITQPCQRSLVNQVGTVLLAIVIILAKHSMTDILLQHLTHHTGIAQSSAVTVQEVREVKMGLELADIAIKLFHTTFVGRRGTTLITTCPLAEHTRMVTGSLEDFRQDRYSRVVWLLTYHGIVGIQTILHPTAPILFIAPYMGMPRVLPCHEAGTRRGRNRTACIGRRHAHSLRCQTVYVRRAEMLLAVAGQITIAHIITHDIEDVGLTSLWLCHSRNSQKGEKESQRLRNRIQDLP